MGWDGMGWKRWGKAGGGWRSDRSSHHSREGRGYGASLGGFGADGWLRYQSIAYLNRAVRSGVLEMVHRTTGVAAPDELVDDSVACTKYNTYLPGAVLKLVGSFQLVELWWRCAETNDDRGSSWAATHGDDSSSSWAWASERDLERENDSGATSAGQARCRGCGHFHPLAYGRAGAELDTAGGGWPGKPVGSKPPGSSPSVCRRSLITDRGRTWKRPSSQHPLDGTGQQWGLPT